MKVRRPPAWVLLPGFALLAATAVVARWAPFAFLFASPWIVGVVYYRLRGTRLEPQDFNFFESARRRF